MEKMYECVIITDPKMNSEKIITMFKNELWGCHVNKAFLKDEGIKHLAYTVKGHENGQYWTLYFKMTSVQLQQWDNILRDNSYVLKFVSLETETELLKERLHGSVPLDCSQMTPETEGESLKKSSQPNGLDVLFGRAEYKSKKERSKKQCLIM